MDRQLSSPSAGSTIVGVLKPSDGGTGGTTQAAALAALGGISAAQLGQPNGVAQLANDGKVNPDNIPADGVTLIAVSGPLSMGINSVATYEITNYDAFTTYNLSALSGTVTRFNSTITYSSAGSAGPAGFRINGRLVAVNIVGDRPATPVLTGVTSGTSKQVTATLTSSAFQMSSGTGTHGSSDWQIAQDSKFDNVLQTSMFNSINLTSFSFNNLSAAVTYFARVRYRDNNGNYSEWSPTVTLVAPLDLVIDTEERKISNPYGSANSGWNRVRLNYDGSRLAVSAYGEDSTTGSVYIFNRVGLSWALEQKLRPADSLADDGFGYFVEFSSDGSRILCTASTDDDAGLNNCGSAYIFLRTGTTWALEQKIYANDKTANTQFGNRGVMDNSATRCVVSSYSTKGSFYVFTRAGTVWTQEQKIDCPVTYAGSQTNFSWLEVSGDGTRIVATHSDEKIGGVATGAVYVYKRTGVTWALEATIFPGAGAAAGAINFGYRAVLNQDGSVMAIGAPNDGIGGRAYVFTRNGTTWNQTATIVPNDLASGDGFAAFLSLSADGKRLAVSSYNATVGALAVAGAAYVYANNGAVWVQESKVAASDAIANLAFGAVIDLSGDGTRLAASSPTTGAGPSGQAVYIYR